jgi:hypothetical protein
MNQHLQLASDLAMPVEAFTQLVNDNPPACPSWCTTQHTDSLDVVGNELHYIGWTHHAETVVPFDGESVLIDGVVIHHDQFQALSGHTDTEVAILELVDGRQRGCIDSLSEEDARALAAALVAPFERVEGVEA